MLRRCLSRTASNVTTSATVPAPSRWTTAVSAKHFTTTLGATAVRYAPGGVSGFHDSGSAGGMMHHPRYNVDPLAFVLRPPRNTIINIIPQGNFVVVERFGRYVKTLGPGLHLLLPWVDRIRYAFSAKEQGIIIPHQSAITKDNVMVEIDGVLFLRIVDAEKAAYNIDNPIFNLMNLAQTTMRAEIGKLSLDKLFEERELLNNSIVGAMRKDAYDWGVECKRYEIRDIAVSDLVRQSMDLQAEAERKKRKLVLESEGEGTADVNRANGRARAQNLASDAMMYEMQRKAEAEAVTILAKNKALAESLEMVAKAMGQCSSTAAGGSPQRAQDAMAAILGARYVEEFGKVARDTTTVVLGSNMADAPGMATQALSVFDGMQRALRPRGGSSPPSN